MADDVTTSQARPRRRWPWVVGIFVGLLLVALLLWLTAGRGTGGGLGNGSGLGSRGQGTGTGKPGQGGTPRGTLGETTGRTRAGAHVTAVTSPPPVGARPGGQAAPIQGAAAGPGTVPGAAPAVTGAGTNPEPEPTPVLFARVDKPVDSAAAKALFDPLRTPQPAPAPVTTVAAYGLRGDVEAAVSAGGSKGVEDAIELGLRWLAARQAADGHWDGQYQLGNSGLATLAFLGAGHTHKTAKSTYKANVERALQWLLTRVQAPAPGTEKKLGTPGAVPRARTANPATPLPAGGAPGSAIISLATKGGIPVDGRGRFVFQTFYEQGIGTMALCEAFGMTGDARLKEKSQLALDYIVACIGPTGGYGYDGSGDDVHVTSFQVMALKSGRLAKLNVPDDAFEALRAYYRRALNPNGTTGYTSGPVPGLQESARTALGLFCRLFLDVPRTAEEVERVAAVVAEAGPQPGDVFQQYYGTYGMFQLGGDRWRAWNAEFRDAAVARQVKEGPDAGSWATAGHCPDRLVTTALYIMALEVYYRYLTVNR